MVARWLVARWLFPRLVLLAALAGCGGSGGAPDASLDAAYGEWPVGLRYISCEEVKWFLDSNDTSMLPINVADEEFYVLGHIPGSLAIPWDLIEDQLVEIDAERNLVIYCRRGVRSESAYDTLAEAGFLHMWIMEGGIERWTELGYPTEV